MRKLLFGYTRGELIVVAGTLLIVSGLSWFNLNQSWQEQRDKIRKADLAVLRQGLVAYFQVHGVYPPHSGDFTILGCGSDDRSICLPGESWTDSGYVYLKEFPQEPKADWPDYGYQTDNETKATKFWLWVFLEKEDDQELAGSWEKCPGSWQNNQYVICQ